MTEDLKPWPKRFAILLYLGLLGPVFGTPLLAVGNTTRALQRPTNNMVADARQVLTRPAANKNDLSVLKVVANPRDVRSSLRSRWSSGLGQCSAEPSLGFFGVVVYTLTHTRVSEDSFESRRTGFLPDLFRLFGPIG